MTIQLARKGSLLNLRYEAASDEPLPHAARVVLVSHMQPGVLRTPDFNHSPPAAFCVITKLFIAISPLIALWHVRVVH